MLRQAARRVVASAARRATHNNNNNNRRFFSVRAGECVSGRAAVVLRSDAAEVKVLLGGGHISSIRSTASLPDGVDDVNPLWQPPWPTADPSLRRLLGPEIGEPGGVGDGLLEGQLLSCIAGHNLTCDVFGGHSKGEVEKAGLCFHGEAGLVQWEVAEVDEPNCSVTLSAHLRHTCLDVSRKYTLSGHVCEVEESITNLCGFERAMGRSQHVTLSHDFLSGSGGEAAQLASTLRSAQLVAAALARSLARYSTCSHSLTAGWRFGFAQGSPRCSQPTATKV